jgi:hypothetical protein
MKIDTRRVHLPLGPQGHAQLRQARDVRLTGIEGVTWITVDGEAADVVIGPGESFVVPNNENVVAIAMQGHALIEIEGRTGAVRSLSTSLRPTWLAGLGRLCLGYR